MARGAEHTKRESTIPQITSIEKIETVLPRYVWVDEDEKQVSPIHKELRSAFSFINGWHSRWARMVEKWGTPNDGEYLHREFEAMTKSGKPPVKLKRVEISITVEDITEEEQKMAEIMMGEM